MIWLKPNAENLMSNQGVEVVGHKHVGGRRKLYVVLGSILGVTATMIVLLQCSFRTCSI